MKKYKVCLITLCKNEEDIIPFCIDYWKKIADKVIVYDNYSTDSSVELLSKHDWIEIRKFESEGQNEFIQKQIKEDSFVELRNEFDIILLCDMDEVFYFNDFDKTLDDFISGGYDVLMTPIYSLCEDFKPDYVEGKLLHELCHKFYKQRMNHMTGFDNYSKLSIFNCKTVDKILMSVGQHYVQAYPNMKIMLSNDGFCLHIDKGFGLSYKWKKRQEMFKNLSKANKMNGFCVEYGQDYEALKKEYENNQLNSFNI